mgnify:FL=1
MSQVKIRLTLSQIVFLLSVVTVLYWLVALNFNIYSNTFISTIFQILAVPFMILIYGLPLAIILLISRLKKFGISY